MEVSREGNLTGPPGAGIRGRRKGIPHTSQCLEMFAFLQRGTGRTKPSGWTKPTVAWLKKKPQTGATEAAAHALGAFEDLETREDCRRFLASYADIILRDRCRP